MTRTRPVAASFPRIEVTARTAGSTVVGTFATGAAQELILFMFLTSLSASAMLIETRRFGVSTRMLASPTSVRTILVGEALGRYAIALVQGLLIVIGTLLLFQVDWGNPLTTGLVVMLFALAATGAAMVMGSVLHNASQAGAMGVFLGLVLAAIGGCMVPLEVFPPLMYRIAHLLPHAWAIEALTDSMATRAGPPEGREHARGARRVCARAVHDRHRPAPPDDHDAVGLNRLSEEPAPFGIAPVTSCAREVLGRTVSAEPMVAPFLRPTRHTPIGLGRAHQPADDAGPHGPSSRSVRRRCASRGLQPQPGHADGAEHHSSRGARRGDRLGRVVEAPTADEPLNFANWPYYIDIAQGNRHSVARAGSKRKRASTSTTSARSRATTASCWRSSPTSRPACPPSTT